MTVTVDFVGERHRVEEGQWLTIGRDADVSVDDNLYLHRRFLQVGCVDGLAWIVNVGEQLSATVADGDGRVQAWLAPGARLPIVFEDTIVRFTAGPTSYELSVHVEAAPFAAPLPMSSDSGDTTIGVVPLTADQRLLIVALAEPLLLQHGRGSAAVPSSAEAAARLGWALTKFNRKLDNVCQKLTKAGVRGLHGSPGDLASNRRARLVDYAVATRLVTHGDLANLDAVASTVPD